MAKVYGKTRPGQGGWAEFETEVDNYLENEVDGYAVTFGMREHAEKYGLGEADDRAAKKKARTKRRILAAILFPTLFLVGVVMAIFNQTLSGIFLFLSVCVLIYLGFSVMWSADKHINREKENKAYVNKKLEKQVNEKRRAEVERLVALARQGRPEETGLPEPLQRVSRGYLAEEQIGEMLEQQLPDSIEVAHDITIHTDSRTGLAKAVDGFDDGTPELMYGTTPGARKFGLAMGILGALGELSRKGAVTANADHVLSTAAGVIMVDTKHWAGELSLDENGQFTAGPNHPGSKYREKAAKTTRFEASRLNGGDVTVIILAVVGGTVQGGRIEQREEGEIPIIAVPAEDVPRVVTELHNNGRLREPISLGTVQGNSPGTQWYLRS